MAAFTMETDGELYLVCEGEQARLPLAAEPDTVRVPSDAPEWARRIARDNGYTPVEADTVNEATVSTATSD